MFPFGVRAPNKKQLGTVTTKANKKSFLKTFILGVHSSTIDKLRRRRCKSRSLCSCSRAVRSARVAASSIRDSICCSRARAHLSPRITASMRMAFARCSRALANLSTLGSLVIPCPRACSEMRVDSPHLDRESRCVAMRTRGSRSPLVCCWYSCG